MDNGNAQNILQRVEHEWARLSEHKFCPSLLTSSNIASLVLLGLIIYANAYFLFESAVAPGSQFFSLIVLFIGGHIAGWMFGFISLPPLLGMLLTGLILRYFEFVHLTGDYVTLASVLRGTALVVILTRAGLGLDAGALKKLSGMVFRLSTIPSVVEGTAVMIMSYYLLGLPWLWGILLGSILAAVSPAVVIPCLFSLQERGYGVEKGIPTVVIAAASLDDIFAISVFGIVLSIVFSTGNLVMTVLQGPLGVLIGVVYGVVMGLTLCVLPNKHDENVSALRLLLVAAGGLFAIFGSEWVGFAGAGALGAIIFAFVAAQGWRRLGWTEDNNPVQAGFALLWTFFQPILFGLIGSEVNISVLDPNVVVYSVISIVVALSFRILACIVITYGGNFNFKERAFVAWAWFPKATVQAALGPVALDLARKTNLPEEEEYGEKLLITAVLSILITAPIGAILISFLGPRLLVKDATVKDSPVEVLNSQESLPGSQDVVTLEKQHSLELQEPNV